MKTKRDMLPTAPEFQTPPKVTIEERYLAKGMMR